VLFALSKKDEFQGKTGTLPCYEKYKLQSSRKEEKEEKEEKEKEGKEERRGKKRKEWRK